MNSNDADKLARVGGDVPEENLERIVANDQNHEEEIVAASMEGEASTQALAMGGTVDSGAAVARTRGHHYLMLHIVS